MMFGVIITNFPKSDGKGSTILSVSYKIPEILMALALHPSRADP